MPDKIEITPEEAAALWERFGKDKNALCLTTLCYEMEAFILAIAREQSRQIEMIESLNNDPEHITYAGAAHDSGSAGCGWCAESEDGAERMSHTLKPCPFCRPVQAATVLTFVNAWKWREARERQQEERWVKQRDTRESRPTKQNR